MKPREKRNSIDFAICRIQKIFHLQDLKWKVKRRLQRLQQTVITIGWTNRYFEKIKMIIAGTHILRIFQRIGLKLDMDLIFSGLVQNVFIYRVAKSTKF